MREQSHNQVRVPSAEGLFGAREGAVAAASGRKERKRKACLRVCPHTTGSVWCEDSEASHHRGKHEAREKKGVTARMLLRRDAALNGPVHLCYYSRTI